MGITTVRTQHIVFASLCLLLGTLDSSVSYAQTPSCSTAGHAGNFYENCASGFCEGQICNGSAYATLNGRNFNGWESIKFGNDTSTCNSTRSGRLRYAGGSTWEYCNGSTWTSLTSGGGSVTWPQSVTSATGGDVFQITGSNFNFLSFSTDTNNTSVFLGREAGQSQTPTFNVENVFVGQGAGRTSNGGQQNTFVGFQAGYSSNQNSNTFIGHSSGYTNSSGSNNTFLGRGSGASNTSGSDNVIIGYLTGFNNTTSTDNTIVGEQAGFSNTTGADNTFIGQAAGYNNTTGNYSIIIGSDTFNASASTSNYLNIGNAIMGSIGNPTSTTANDATITIDGSLVVTGTCTGCGGAISWPQSVTSATGGDIFQITGSNHNFLGFSTDTNNTSVFLGRESGNAATATSNNTFVGYRSGALSTAGTNTFIGSQAGYNNTTGGNNVFVGTNTGYSNTTGQYNTFIGTSSGGYTTTANDNTFIGYTAGFNNTTGESNTFVGRNAGYNNSSGLLNVFLGVGAGLNNTTGQQNTFVGTNAGHNITTGNSNIMIGMSITGSSVTVTEELNIGNAIYGTLNDGDGTIGKGDNDSEIVIDGIVKIGERSPTCNVTYEGYMRYNSSTKKMQYCNATAWTDM